jgi:site-specific DNA recombinase
MQALKERFAIGKISEEIYQEFAPQYQKKILDIEKELENISHDSSNLDEHLQTALEGAAKLVNVWKLLDYTEKQRLQYLVFPGGGVYDRKNDEVRTPEINFIFSEIARLTGNTEQNNSGQTNTQIDLPAQVGTTRFELATPRPPAWYATGLRYVPNIKSLR